MSIKYITINYMICYEDRTFMNDAQELISENNENQFIPYGVMSHDVVIM